MVKSPLLCLKEAIQSIIANASPPKKKKIRMFIAVAHPLLAGRRGRAPTVSAKG